MNDQDLAKEIIKRLNTLIESHPDVKRDVGKLIEARIPCSQAVLEHPTIQASEGIGFLGLLNGLVGAITDGNKKGWGYITAEFEDDMTLVRFRLTLEESSVGPSDELLQPYWLPTLHEEGS